MEITISFFMFLSLYVCLPVNDAMIYAEIGFVDAKVLTNKPWTVLMVVFHRVANQVIQSKFLILQPQFVV